VDEPVPCRVERVCCGQRRIHCSPAGIINVISLAEERFAPLDDRRDAPRRIEERIDLVTSTQRCMHEPECRIEARRLRGHPAEQEHPFIERRKRAQRGEVHTLALAGEWEKRRGNRLSLPVRALFLRGRCAAARALGTPLAVHGLGLRTRSPSPVSGSPSREQQRSEVGGARSPSRRKGR
jgi:hypothetical protein